LIRSYYFPPLTGLDTVPELLLLLLEEEEEPLLLDGVDG
jgi:hypothetical protein